MGATWKYVEVVPTVKGASNGTGNKTVENGFSHLRSRYTPLKRGVNESSDD